MLKRQSTTMNMTDVSIGRVNTADERCLATPH